MSVLIDMPVSIEAQVIDYAKATGRTIQQTVLDCLLRDIHRVGDGARRVNRFRELLSKQTKLTGEPYRFRRQDAYEGELA